MIFRLATNDADAGVVRQIRNSGRQWMTRDSSEITVEQQRAWWRARNPATLRIWLARAAETDVAYGLLRLDRGRWWCSLAVLPRYQGQGYGTELYRYLGAATTESVWAEILADNTPSIKACLSAGFQIVSAFDRVVHLVHLK